MKRQLQAAVGECAGRGLLIGLVIAVVLLSALSTASAFPAKSVPQRLLVGVRPWVASAQVATELQSKTPAKVSRQLVGGRVLVLDFPPEVSTAEMYARAQAIPGVDFVEPDLIVYPTLIPNDPEYPKQYHWPLIRAPEGWDLSTGGLGVVIAFVDTGCDLDHPDLAGRIFVNRGEIPGNGTDDDHNGFVDDVHGWDFYNNNNDPNPEPDGIDNDANGDPDDQVSHGTLVAGTACATGNNGWGVVGMNWGASILPIQVFPDDGGSSVSRVIEGIDYAVAMGANIINLSLGGGYAQSFTPAIANARAHGILVVAAGGNSGRELRDAQSTWESPVCNDGTLGVDNNVLGVGATDQNDRLGSFSNFDGSTPRRFIECCAPGQAIYGPACYDPRYPHLASYFYTNTGTSFAAPMVSGLAAILMSLHPTWTPDQVRAAILEGCDDIDALNPGFEGKLGAGRINVARTLGVPLPPRPPRDVSAVDTPDDEGGSITVQWLCSLDDGAGSNSVTEYIVRRRRGTGGGFVEVGRVPAGSTQFVDATVTDGVNYYYQVLATDGSLQSTAVTVGPVQSRNDKPPAKVTGVQAFDTPNDDGGSITITWDPYTAPPDFAHFAIYRAGGYFANLGALNPIATIADAGATSYRDETVVDGAEYYYVVGAVDQFGNVDREVVAVGPVQSFANGAITLPAGLHFIGPPVQPNNPDAAAFLGIAPERLQLAVYNPEIADYERYSAGTPVQVALGRGFWLRLTTPHSFVPNGALAPAGNLGVQLAPGWRQVANPYFGPIDFANATVTYEGTTMDLASADAANVMRRVAWTYNRTTNSYNLLAPGLGLGSTEVGFMQGLWVLVEKNCTLTLPRPGGAASAAPAAAKGPGDGWVARLCVRGAGGTDTDNFFGVSPRLAALRPLVSPPAPPGGVGLHFLDESQPASRLAGRFVGVEAGSLQWRLVVEAAAGGPLELWCPDVSDIGSSWSVWVEDPSTGQVTDIGRGGRYSFTMAANEGARVLVLRLTRRAGGLTLASVTAQQNGAGGAQVTFTLSAPARCAVRVLNIAGRVVRTVESERLRPQGANEVIWNGRSDQGTLVPGGLYLVVVEAVGEDGARARAMGSLALRR